MIDPVKILQRAWRILWNYRALWVFGLILALAAGGSYNGGGNNGVQWREDSQSYQTPPPESMQEFFRDFNREYVQTLARWGIYTDEVNPVARTNVCPAYDAPPEPALYAFSYTVPAPMAKRGSFIIAGGGEARDGAGSFAGRSVRLGETTPEAMREKVRFVMAEMERRLAALGFSWKDALSTQTYTVQDIGAFVGAEIAARGAAAGGLTWHFARPPVIGLEYEMDVRGAARELLL